MIAHVAGIPFEELLLALSGAGAGMFAVRVWLGTRMRPVRKGNAR